MSHASVTNLCQKLVLGHSYCFHRLDKTAGEMMTEHGLTEANYALLEQPIGLNIGLQVQVSLTASRYRSGSGIDSLQV